MERPNFYNIVKASGLVKDHLLSEIRDALLNRASDAVPSTIPFIVGTTGGGLYEKWGTAGTVDQAEASLDGQVDSDALALATDTDLRLANELVQRGFLTRWQSIQLLEGRTKFTLGNYRVVDAIGQGGYGHVFLARASRPLDHEAEQTGQRVALKVLPLAKATPEMTARFLHEIEIHKDLDHQNIVRFIESGHDGNVHFMVHEFIDGGDSRMFLQRKEKLHYEIAAKIIFHVAEALQHLHQRGIVHRDVKPSNILLCVDGSAKLTDMGLAVPVTDGVGARTEFGEEDAWLERQIDRATRSGKIAGTVDYMAPDQIRGPAKPSPSWDIYSLGCTFYQFLTGFPPFSRDRAGATPSGRSGKRKLRDHLQTAPVDPRIYEQTIPYSIAEMVLSMLAKETQWRPKNASEIAQRLAPWLPRTMKSEKSWT